MSEFEELLEKARALRRSGQTSEAEYLLSTCDAKEEFDQARLLTERSRVKRDIGALEDSVALLNQATTAKKDYQAAYLDRMIARIKLQEYAYAISDANELRSIDELRGNLAFTGTADLHAAYCYYKLGDKIQARRLLDGLSTVTTETRIGGSGMSVGQLLSKLE